MKNLMIIFSTILVFGLSTDLMGQEVPNMENLHAKCMPIFEKYAKDADGGSLDCMENSQVIRIYHYKGNDDNWIEIYKKGMILFKAKSYQEDEIIIKKGEQKINYDIISSVAEVLRYMMSYKDVIILLEPYFDKECYSFLQNEMPKAEKILAECLFNGQSDLKRGDICFRPSGIGHYNDYYFSWISPINWSIEINGVEYSSLLASNTSMSPIGGIHYFDKNGDTYTCTPFYCQKETDYKTYFITLQEFKKYYTKIH